MKLTDFQILLIAAGLMFSPKITHEQAKKYIQAHPKFAYKAAAGL